MRNTEPDKIELLLIRHGRTAGNEAGRYIGRTDEPLSENGRRALTQKSYPGADRVFCSPMLRTRQTAELIYPDHKIEIADGLQEMDFGILENRTHEDLKDNPEYLRWVDVRGTSPMPGGETREAFDKRTRQAFERIIDKMRADGTPRAAIIVHGGTIMSILSAVLGGDYYSYHVENGGGYRLELDAEDRATSCERLEGGERQL